MSVTAARLQGPGHLAGKYPAQLLASLSTASSSSHPDKIALDGPEGVESVPAAAEAMKEAMEQGVGATWLAAWNQFAYVDPERPLEAQAPEEQTPKEQTADFAVLHQADSLLATYNSLHQSKNHLIFDSGLARLSEQEQAALLGEASALKHGVLPAVLGEYEALKASPAWQQFEERLTVSISQKSHGQFSTVEPVVPWELVSRHGINLP